MYSINIIVTMRMVDYTYSLAPRPKSVLSGYTLKVVVYKSKSMGSPVELAIWQHVQLIEGLHARTRFYKDKQEHFRSPSPRGAGLVMRSCLLIIL